MQGKNRSEAKFGLIMRYFAHDLPTSKLAALRDVSRPTINQRFLQATNQNRPALWRLIAFFWRGWSGWILFWHPPCSGKKGAWRRG